MPNKINTALLPLAVFVLLITSSVSALAQAFDDVSDDAWYFSYVEQLASEGIIDANDSFRPDDALTRAELANMIIKSIDGLTDFVPPATPTFTDVSVDAWYYSYVEAAAELGIVDGYSDANGNKTGMFGPGDTVTRAAATKILASAFSISNDVDSDSIFPDVSREYWYFDYVASVYMKSIADGYENGYFGPSDPATRAQIAKLIVNAKNPVERVAAISEEPIVEVIDEVVGLSSEIEIEESGLVVSLNPYQSPPLTVPIASASPLINIDLTATGSDVHISGITLTRSGVGNASDWYGIYLYEGFSKITSEYGVNRSTNKVNIPLNLYIKAGTTTTLTAYGDTDVVASPLNQHAFSLNSATDITADALNVTGDLPVSGNVITIGSQFTNTLSIVPGATPLRPTRDTHAEIASFVMTAGATSDVAVTALILTQGGTFSSSKMTDCSLLQDSDVIARSPGFYQDQLIFGLETPYVVPESQGRNFYVDCYINGGRTTDTIQLYLDEVYDLLTTHVDFGFSAVPLNGYTRTLTPSLNLDEAWIRIQ